MFVDESSADDREASSSLSIGDISRLPSRSISAKRVGDADAAFRSRVVE